MRAFRRSKIGCTIQQPNLMPFLNALANGALMLQSNAASRRESPRRANDLLGHREIGHRANPLLARLAGGKQQRVTVGRSLANEPALILPGEPPAALDTKRRTKVTALLRRIARAAGR